MKIRYGIVSGLTILAIIFLAGVGAAEETTTLDTPNLTETRPLPPPLPDTLMTGNMTTGNGTRNYQYRPDFNGTVTNRSLGPGNPLYGLRIAFEDLDESFTFNQTERLEKQIRHGDGRLADYLTALSDNTTESADHAFAMYRQKMNQTEDTLHQFRSNETGLLHAQEMIMKHQGVLGALLEQNPDNPGLARAYNNSQQLQNKFEEKTRVRFEKADGNGNSTAFRPVMIENTNGKYQPDTNSAGNANRPDRNGSQQDHVQNAGQQQDTSRGQQNQQNQQNNNQDTSGQNNGHQQSEGNGQGNGQQNQGSNQQQSGTGSQNTRQDDNGRNQQQPGQGNGQKR